ncbi:unnamed protein product [Fasciola hepatica]|uniref:Uncharacterized protein n=1 Tax=Fasciola hepatica TaxID=6192 RepID=A0ABC9HF09_FASHE|nr:unnamed protein product [Fasciola hepatica]
MPADSPYDKPKAAVLKRTSSPDEAGLQQLLTGAELGNRTPSQLVRYMPWLDAQHRVSEASLRQLWTNRLPAETRAILSVEAAKAPLEKLSETVSKIHTYHVRSARRSYLEVAWDKTSDRRSQPPENVPPITILVHFQLRTHSQRNRR